MHYSLVVYCIVYQCNEIDYSIKLVHLKINGGTTLYDITLLIIYFKMRRFSLFYNKTLKKFFDTRKGSPLLHQFQQESPHLKLSTSSTDIQQVQPKVEMKAHHCWVLWPKIEYNETV